MYVTVPHAVYIITYTQRSVSLISGSSDSNSYGYRDSTLLDWPMSSPSILHRTSHSACSLQKLRLVDINSVKVTTLNVTKSLTYPSSILLTNNSLYVGQYQKIIQYKCEFSIITIQQLMIFHTRQHVQQYLNIIKYFKCHT